MRRRIASCFLLLAIMLFTVDKAEATTHEFTVEPEGEITIFSRELSRFDSIRGNISVQGGPLDFYITDPTGEIVFSQNQTVSCGFDIVASESGDCAFHFVNIHSNKTLTAKLDYGIGFQQAIGLPISVGTSVGTAHIVSLPVVPTLDDHTDEIDQLRIDLYGRYLLRQSEQMLNGIREFWKYLDLNPAKVLAVGILALTFTLCVFFMPSDPLEKVRQIVEG